MDRNRMIVLWVAGAAGVVLLYSAYKGKSPLSVLNTYAAGTGAASSAPVTIPNTTGTTPTGGPVHLTSDTTTDLYSSNPDGWQYPVPAAYKDNPSLFVPSVN